jgi:probable short chain dehydrogenase
MQDKQKIAIVTGASRGIGREVAKELAESGITVIANYNKSEEEAKKLQQELEEQNFKLEIFKADVSKREDVKKLVEYTIEKYGKIDILINNAGISEYKLFTDETDEDWDKLINTNLYSAFAMSQEVIPNMVHNKKGCIINISSIWGIVGGSLEVLYSISKAGLDGMTKALAKELGPSNIRVNSIAPGMINTKMNSKFTEKEIEEIKEEIPLERLGDPQDIAKCVKWLIDDNYTTGQVISINGGWVIT